MDRVQPTAVHSATGSALPPGGAITPGEPYPQVTLLALEDVIQFLIDHDLTTVSAVANEGANVVDVSRRNNNYLVRIGSGGFLVKQGVDEARSRTVAREAAVYDWLWSDGRASTLATRFIPRLHLYDPVRGVLVLELIESSETLIVYHRKRGRFPIVVARSLGRFLARLHEASSCADLATNTPPYFLSLHEPDLRLLEVASQAGISLVRIIQGSPGFPAKLDEVRRCWRSESLLHGDLRWDNVHVVRDRSRGRGGLRIVDWELADRGDPAWDVATFVAEYLRTWVQFAPISGLTPPSDFLHLARHSIDDMRPAIRAFWNTYSEHRRIQRRDSEAFLGRTVRYVAVRLIQTAFEWAQVATHVADAPVYLLQLSHNILCRPEETLDRLLGIPPPR